MRAVRSPLRVMDGFLRVGEFCSGSARSASGGRNGITLSIASGRKPRSQAGSRTGAGGAPARRNLVSCATVASSPSQNRRTARNAGRVQAVVASHGEMHPLGWGKDASLDLVDATPQHLRRVVLLGASHLEALAADALGRIEIKPVQLLPILLRDVRNQRRLCRRALQCT